MDKKVQNRQLLRLLLLLTCVRVINATNLTFDLAGFSAFDVRSNLPKASFTIYWDIRRDAAASAAVALEVEAPDCVCVATSLRNNSESGGAGTALLGLGFGFSCDGNLTESFEEHRVYDEGRSSTTMEPIMSSSNSCRPWPFVGAIEAGILAVAAAASSQKRIAMTIFAITLALVVPVLHGQYLDDCQNTPIKLTLVVQPNQWAVQAGCGYCTVEDGKRFAHFEWRDPCNMTAAVAAFNTAGTTCNTSTSCLQSLGRCDLDGWCSNVPCSIPSDIDNTCMHPYFKDKLMSKAGLSAAGKDVLDYIFECAGRMTPVAGRPYTTSAGALVADAQWCSGHAEVERPGLVRWESLPGMQPLGDASPPKDWTPELAAIAASFWLKQGQDEHASVASFARYTLDLMRFAAPPKLLLAAQAAGMDEVRHASDAFSLASLFRGQQSVGVEVAGFPIGEDVQLSPSIHAMSTRILEEGCLGESAAVARMVYALKHMHADSPARSTVAQLLQDEVRHASLAWASIVWAYRQGAALPPLDDRLQTAAAVPVTESRVGPLLIWGGRVHEADAAQISSQVARSWVATWLDALTHKGGKSQALFPRVMSDETFGSVVAEAAELVRVELENLQASIVV